MLLDPTEDALNIGYRYTNGGECMPLISLIGSIVKKVQKENLNPKETFVYFPTLCIACNYPQFPILYDLSFKTAGVDGLKIGLINYLDPGDTIPQSVSVKIVQSYIISGIIRKLYYRIIPYEKKEGQTEKIFQKSVNLMSEAILMGRNLRSALQEVTDLFRDIPRDEAEGRKPRVGLLGDVYVKFNEVINQKILHLVHELGGELIVPSLTEYLFHFYDVDIRLHGEDSRRYGLLKTIEKRFEQLATDLIGGQEEPDFEECVRLTEEYGITHYIAGETAINVGRALYFIKKKLVEAILHVNPIFCYPGVVTSSIYRKMQQVFGIPIIDIFYDGTGNPNSILIPHLHYLKQSSSE